MNKESKRIITVLVLISMMFVGLVVYLSYFEVFQAAKVEENSYNKRQWINEGYVLRGKISDRNGKTLVYSDKKENDQVRHYTYGNLYSHIIGYSYKEYGKAGLEASYNKELLNISDNNPIKEIKEKITGPRENGNNIILTIDHELQEDAEKLLRGKKGSIVLMNPQNGEIYAMISKPDFNPETLKEDWEEIVEDSNSPLLNRGTMGLYTPGSVFKVITTTGALESSDIDKNFQCRGSITIDGYELKDYKGIAHGNVDLEEALIKSCNVSFSQIGLELGKENLKKTSEKYMFNKIIPFDLPTKKSIFPQNHMSDPELAASSIGQGKILVTPLNMAMVASSIANNGLMMNPHLVKEVLSPDGRMIKTQKVQSLSRVCGIEIAKEIKEMMVKVVDHGTGRGAKIRNIEVAGKTGTAENETGKSHAWFIGFAPAYEPKVAVVVILENEGSTGGKSAAPIARDLMIRAINRL